MKRFFRKFTVWLCLSVLTLCVVFLVGCDKKQDFSQNITELRTGVYTGQSDTHTLSAYYGYRESPYKHNGTGGDKIYGLTFKLKDKSSTASTEVNYSLSFNFNGNGYKDDFFYNPGSNVLTAFFEIKDFSPEKFDLTLSYGDKNDVITMENAVPEGTVSIDKALACLSESQKEIFDNFRNSEGKFTGEIHARLLVKDGKAFWYIDVSDTSGKIQAFLVDGKSCETLAVRRIY